MKQQPLRRCEVPTSRANGLASLYLTSNIWWKGGSRTALNIKHEAVHRDTRRLATLTDQSITDVVRDAIAAKLREAERKQAHAVSGRDAEAILEAAAACNATFRLGGHSADHASLYGDDGLPA